MLIEAKGLVKDYSLQIKGKGLSGMVKSLFKSEKRIVHAVQNIDLSIDEGEIVGYIGPNGAGKSTTIKMLSGVLEPTSGSISVCGIVPQKHRIENAKNIGAVFGQKTQLWWDLPVRESFEVLRRMYEIPREVYDKNIRDFNEYLEMGKIMQQPVRQLSLGQRMRAEIAASLLHNPKVLFLDEPTIGLDINVKLSVREFIRRINKERNVTIMLTTHDLQDIEELAKRIIVINHGQICFDGGIGELSSKFGLSKKQMTIKLKEEAKDIVLPNKLLPYVDIETSGFDINISYDKGVNTADIVAFFVNNFKVSDIDIKGHRIEDIVMEVYKA